MTHYQLMPNLTLDEYEALRADIAARGVMVAVEVDETGAILDGHNRAAIAAELGIDYPTVVRSGMTEDQKVEHVLALNLDRRQLSREQRAELVATLRRQRMSLRRIAEVVHVDPVTVKNDLARVESSTPDSITGADGKTYPARRPDPPLDPTYEAEVAVGLDVLAQSPEVVEATEHARWSGLLAASARVINEGRSANWKDRLTRADRERLASHLRRLRSWVDEWEAALAEPPVRLVSGGRR